VRRQATNKQQQATTSNNKQQTSNNKQQQQHGTMLLRVCRVAISHFRFSVPLLLRMIIVNHCGL
jgi:hypothetical protein